MLYAFAFAFTSSMSKVNNNSPYSPVRPWFRLSVYLRLHNLSVCFGLPWPLCIGAGVTNLNEPPLGFCCTHYCGLGAGSVPV